MTRRAAPTGPTVALSLGGALGLAAASFAGLSPPLALVGALAVLVGVARTTTA